VYDVAAEAVARARRGDGPTLLEAKTVRWGRHSAVAAGPAGANADRWKLTDPIPRFRQELLQRGVISEAQAAEIEQSARAVIDDAVAFAIASPYPGLEELRTDVYAD
jgi:TPP-dependent pyruvate/acetoin dehydrogenase alpha subunit